MFLEQNPTLRGALSDYEGAMRGNSAHDRREFLRSSIALGLATLPLTAAITNCAAAPKKFAESDLAGGTSPQDPVIILGAGLAGLTAAYRLVQAGLTCEIYEAQSRLGGRVYTKDQFNSEGMYCEFGGELIDSQHKDLLTLARELELKVDDFRPYDAHVKEHQFFIGGRHYYDDDLTAAAAPMAQRLVKDMNQVFAGLEVPVITYQNPSAAAVKFDRTSLEEYLYGMTDVDKWVRDAINVAYLTEYGLDTGEQSSLNLMMLLNPEDTNHFGIFGDSDEAHHVHGGNSRLIDALTNALQGRAKIHLSSPLTQIRDKGSKLQLTFGRGGSARYANASRVICTIPFTILRDIEGVEALDLSPVKHRAIQNIGYGQNTKHMIGFTSRHWRKPQGSLPGASGYTFTNLPSQTLWDSSRLQHGKSGIITTFLGGSAAVDPTRGTIPSILSDMEQICPGSSSLYDGNHAIFRWPAHPYVKGSYACPKAGQYTTLVGSAKEPELSGRLLFAGEHVSEAFQGYMNGAVQTGNWAARAIIKQVRAVHPVAERSAPALSTV
jgi:monoamine oxidase